MQNYNYANAGAAVPTPGPGTTNESITVDHTWNNAYAGGCIVPGGTIDANAVYQGTQAKEADNYVYDADTVAAHNSTVQAPVGRQNLINTTPDISPAPSYYQGSSKTITPGPDNVPVNGQFDK